MSSSRSGERPRRRRRRRRRPPPRWGNNGGRKSSGTGGGVDWWGSRKGEGAERLNAAARPAIIIRLPTCVRARAPSTRSCVVRMRARACVCVCLRATDRRRHPRPSARVDGRAGGRRLQKPPVARYRGLAVGSATAKVAGPYAAVGLCAHYAAAYECLPPGRNIRAAASHRRSPRRSAIRRRAAGRLCRRCSADYFSQIFHSTLTYTFYTHSYEFPNLFFKFTIFIITIYCVL